MPKLPDTFEDWTPPWDEDSFDADKAARRIFNTEKKLEKAKQREAALEDEKDELETRLSAAESKASGKDDSAKDQEIADLKKERDALAKNGRPEDQDKIARLTVAMEFGLDPDDADRLRGKNLEELQEDAEKFAERLGITKGDPDGSEGGDGKPEPKGPPQRGVTPKEKLGNGRKPADQGTPPTVEEIMAERYGAQGATQFLGAGAR